MAVDRSFALLDSDRVVLRRFRAEDAPALAAYRSDPEVARYQAYDGCSLEEAQRFVASLADAQPGAPGRWFQFAVSLDPSGPLIGDCALRCTRSDPRQAELGFSFARASQGRGLATEAVRRLLAYAFGTLGLHRVFAIADLRNDAAHRLLGRAGFRREGHFVENAWFKGGWASEILFAQLRREWEARSGAARLGAKEALR